MFYSHIYLVLQLKENIKYGKLDATDEEVVAAAKIVGGADKFIIN